MNLGDQKLKIMDLMKILLEETAEEHDLTLIAGKAK